MKLTKSEVEEVVVKIFTRLSEGLTDKEVMDEIGVSAEDYNQFKAAMFDAKAEEIRGRPIEHVYVEYLINQASNIKDLTDLVIKKGSHQLNAMVGAVRVRAEIYDKIIKTGQEMGVIKRAPQQHEVIGGIIVADLTSEKLRALITNELRELGGLMKKYGDKGILDMEPGSLHYGPALPAKTSADGEDDLPTTRPAPTSPTAVKRLPPHLPPKAGMPAPESKFVKAFTAKAKTGRRVIKDGPLREVPLLRSKGLA